VTEPDSKPVYRVTELTEVCDRSLEDALNREAASGFRFESIHFVVQPGNRRPTMAFLFFSLTKSPEKE
jgi:hypothetical protein